MIPPKNRTFMEKGVAMPRKILLPVSGKAQGEPAVQAISSFRSIFDNAELVFLHVIDPISNRIAGEDHKKLLQEAMEETLTLAPQLFAYARQEKLNYRVCVDEGSPVDAIIKHAHQESCDLIVMFTDGRDNVGDMLLGSITERVLRNCTLPLLVFHK